MLSTAGRTTATTKKSVWTLKRKNSRCSGKLKEGSCTHSQDYNCSIFHKNYAKIHKDSVGHMAVQDEDTAGSCTGR